MAETDTSSIAMETDTSMEKDVTSRNIADGALADDERTEAERSPPGEVQNKPGVPREREGKAQSPIMNNNTEMEKQSPTDDPSQRKKKHRRGKMKGGRRHWKPYNKLSWDERLEKEERETQRACRKREEQFAAGHPLAPYNTTQFLMEQHEHEEGEFNIADIENRQRGARGGDGAGSASVDSSDEYDSPENEDIFLEKDFDATYKNCHEERLQSMSKEELLRECIELENRVDSLEKRLKRDSPTTVIGNGLDHNKKSVTERLPSEESMDILAASQLEKEIKKLREENARLLKENQELQANQCAINVGISEG